MSGTSMDDFGGGREVRESVFRSLFAGLVSLVLFAVAPGCGGGGGGGGSSSDTGGDTGMTGDGMTDTASPDPDSSPDEEVNLPDRVLEPGGMAVTNAAALGAAEGALEFPVAVSTESAEDSTSETPLPPEASAAGDFVEVSGDRDIYIPAGDSPLYLVLPLPGDAEPSNLGLAVLEGGRETAGSELPADIQYWSVLPGMYDSQNGLFVVPVRFLRTDGMTVGLVESDTYDAPALSGSSESGGSARPTGIIDGGDEPVGAVRAAIDGATSRPEQSSQKDDFYVVCRGFDGSGCGDAVKSDVRDHLNSIHSDFSSGFAGPALRRTLPGRTVDGREGRFYRYVVRPEGSERPCREGDGLYSPFTRTAVTCHDPSTEDPPSQATTRMEYFHAMQYTYPFFDRRYAGNKGAAWLLEGPAAVAKNTNSTADKAVRWNRTSGAKDLRNVDTSLTARTGKAPFPAEGTQDFWVYWSRSENLSPKELFVPLWESNTGRAPSITDVNESYDLASAHWGWVRNQAFEARVTDGNSDLNGTCVPDSNAWGSIDQTVVYDTVRPGMMRDRLELSGDWTAEVLKVEIHNPSNYDYKAIFGGSSDTGYLKVYPARNSPGKHCLHRNEGPSETGFSPIIEAGETWEAYLVLSNSGRTPTDKRQYDVGATIRGPRSDQKSPSVIIERPEAVDYTLKRNTLLLKADATDPGGGYIETLEWTVRGSGGTSKTYRGEDLAIDDFWSEGFQPGTFSIEVFAKDDDGQETTVTFQVDIEQK